MEIGIDSFAATEANNSGPYDAVDSGRAMAELLERMVFADEVGLDIFGIGQHFRKEFLARTLLPST